MSAEVLREAADAMRGDFGDSWIRGSWEAGIFFATADLMERAANEPWCCEDCKYAPENQNWVLSALAVARAYLGADR